MKCIITAGPTHEPLDEVRRLTNFSTGRLGSEFAGFLSKRGHPVTLMLGESATWRGELCAAEVKSFSTTADLRRQLKSLARTRPDAIFHAAAVSDFAVGRIWERSPAGKMTGLASGKISTRNGNLLAELVPTPKIISELRQWHSRCLLVGWKYEVEGSRRDVIALARKQIAGCRTDACVTNGPAYGAGFGLV